VEEMSYGTQVKDECETKKTSRHGKVPPRNPNKKATTINLKRSIGRMKADSRKAIRRAAE